MEQLTLDQFRFRSQEFDAAVVRTPDIADFCSSSHWILPAHQCIHRHEHDQDGVEVVHEDGHWLMFAQGQYPFLEPWESMWCFSCPLIGPDPEFSIELLRKFAESRGERSAFLVGGVPRDGALHRVTKLTNHAHVEEWAGIQCMLVDLSEGLEVYLERRSRKFRKGIRQSARRIEEMGVTLEVETRGDDPKVVERILRLQERSHKWATGEDILQNDLYLDFYKGVAASSARQGGFRAVFVRHNGEDVAYIMGAVFGSTYRGLQMAYDEEFAQMGLGSWLQVENMKLMVEAGVPYYDLGMHSPYKERWIDRQQDLVNCVMWFL